MENKAKSRRAHGIQWIRLAYKWTPQRKGKTKWGRNNTGSNSWEFSKNGERWKVSCYTLKKCCESQAEKNANKTIHSKTVEKQRYSW